MICPECYEQFERDDLLASLSKEKSIYQTHCPRCVEKSQKKYIRKFLGEGMEGYQKMKKLKENERQPLHSAYDGTYILYLKNFHTDKATLRFSSNYLVSGSNFRKFQGQHVNVLVNWLRKMKFYDRMVKV